MDLACSLNDRELAARRAQWRALDDKGLVRTEVRPNGRLLVYRGGERTARVLRGLIEAERECCAFLRFDVRRRGKETEVMVTFPPEARPAAVSLGIVPA